MYIFALDANLIKRNIMAFENFDSGFRTMDVKDLFFRGDGEDTVIDNPLEGLDENGDKKDDKPDEDVGPVDPEPGKDDKGDTVVDEPDAPVVSHGLNGKSILEKMAKRGIIDNIGDMEITVDDKPVDLASITDEDEILDIVESLVKSQREDMLRDKVDTSSISDFMRKMIEVDKAGGNVGALLDTYRKFQEPVDSADLSTREGQLAVIHHYYKMLGMSDDDIKDNMELMEGKDDDYVEAKARKFDSVIKERMSSMVEQEKQRAEDRKKEAMERMKTYKKGLRSSISNNFQLSDNMVSKAVDFVTKVVDKDGRVGIDLAYMDMVKDPQKAADLVLFLMNKDEYLRQVTNKSNMDVKRNVIKLVSSSKAGKGGTAKPDDDVIEGSFLEVGESKPYK